MKEVTSLGGEVVLVGLEGATVRAITLEDSGIVATAEGSEGAGETSRIGPSVSCFILPKGVYN